jgi:hypothetical protein
MKFASKAIVGAALALMAATPAMAGWKLVPHGSAIKVAKGTLCVTPADDWNRWTGRPIEKGEEWTLDGLALNQLYFVSGLAPGETLFKDAARKDKPLPAMGAAMQLTDIPDFVESSIRVALNTSAFQITNVQPATLGGHPAVKFVFEYADAASSLRHKGIAVGTVVNKQLYLINFTAPALFYFDHDAPKVEAIIATATL